MDKKKNNELQDDGMFPLPQKNLTFIGIGVLIVIIGFFLVAGGGSKNPNVFNYDIFDARRIIIAPLVILFGYLFIIYAILKKSKNNN